MKVCEYFRSIQGEGLMIGLPTYFVRVAGCNLSCSWCDTKYAREEPGMDMSVDQIMELIGDDRSVCITGGEPLLQKDMPELLSRLIRECKQVVLETNGSIDLSGVPDSPNLMISMDIKCPSSGMEGRMCLSNLNILTMKDQIKFIIADKKDFYYALRFLEEHPVNTNVIFGPVGGVDLKYIAEEAIQRRLNVRVLPQLHKVIWGEKRSV